MFDKTIQIQGKLIDFNGPKLMGILNLTPDSFYDGGKFEDKKAALAQVKKMLDEGADFIDVGAMSSRPGSNLLSAEQELKRLLPVLEYLLEQFPSKHFSVDTFYSCVAQKVLAMGVPMINDITSGNADPEILAVVSEFDATYVMMHMQGMPQNMQNNPSYENTVQDILYFFSKKISEVNEAGINNLILDPGFGFGKTIYHNYEILSHLNVFKTLGLPILVGLSRKSMISKPLSITPKETLNGTSVLHTKALLQGANILRVHDVKAAKECIDLVALMQ
tara:strand:+ start:3535 stop:4365 length:831 start_codon:yes stop_codon:yes gene_type:complete